MCLAVPGQIVDITGDDPITRMARVSFGGVIKEVSLAYTPEAVPGDYVLVHVGFALNTVDEEEAQKTLELLRQLEPAGAETIDDAPGGEAA
ncbi:MAG: HypC/HybG/HupF family hydrogenase formation chaperone [Candidatus Solibacter usitatus]|nr:HypC/HybG/HupF family hydrogenase formation chaperone [Candidatus Solibacter usitatus]